MNFGINRKLLVMKFHVIRGRFLYSVNLTEYVAMEPRVCVCMYVCVCVCVYVCVCVCVCVTALQPKRMDGF